MMKKTSQRPTIIIRVYGAADTATEEFIKTFMEPDEFTQTENGEACVRL